MKPQKFPQPSIHETTRIADPALSALYAGAILEKVRRRRGRLSHGRGLPGGAVVVRHPGIGTERLESYRRLVKGEVFDGVHRLALPSVLVHIMAFPGQMSLLASEDFPLPLMGMVHLGNAVEHRRPLAADSPVQIRTWTEGLRAHRRGTQFDVITEVLTEDADVEAPADQDLLWQETSTYLSRGTHLAGVASEESRSVAREEFAPPRKTAQWHLDADIGRRYASVSGDWNPIHLSSLSAKALGMRSAIAHGMYAAGRMLEGREPQQAGHRWSIRFEAPIRLPGTVAFGARSTASDDEVTVAFSGWDPRTGRRHFSGELARPD